MWLVLCNPGVAQGAIGAALGMDRATMMVIVDRLETRGLLQRVRSRKDARQRELVATPEGQRLMKKVQSRTVSHEKRLKAAFHGHGTANVRAPAAEAAESRGYRRRVDAPRGSDDAQGLFPDGRRIALVPAVAILAA